MSPTDFLEKVSTTDFDRRKFFKRAGTAGLGIAAASVLGRAAEKLSATTTLTDADIVNFALNLEYLEGEFYSVATFGATLEQRGVIPSSAVDGPTTGGKMVPFGGSPLVLWNPCRISRDCSSFSDGVAMAKYSLFTLPGY